MDSASTTDWLAAPEKQVSIGDDDGFIGRVDFLRPVEKVVVEIDSRLHDGPLDRQADARRDEQLRALGYEVLRFRWTDLVSHPDGVLRKVGKALSAGVLR